MPNLVIGHTGETSACIWVRGSNLRRRCEITLSPATGREPERIDLRCDSDYTGTVTIDGLRPGVDYRVTAAFSPGPVIRAYGRFRTLPKQPAGAEFSFSFVLSSCNLSVVSISNLLAFLTTAVGTSVALSSLELPLPRWRYPVLGALLRHPARGALSLIAFFVNKGTEVKLPPPPFLRSPFLKVCAVFDAHLVEIFAAKDALPGVGDLLLCAQGRGVLACSPAKLCDVEDDVARWKLVLTQTEGTFTAGDEMYRQSVLRPHNEPSPVGVLVSSVRARPWYTRPQFFIHAGDQIYYDFPHDDRAPDLNEYRLAYREAWFDDEANRYLLAHWPHYMTLDDHEITDQFARDFQPPPLKPLVCPDHYRREASVAYRDYVDARNPPPEPGNEARRRKRGPYWFTFEKGDSRFFVLDTRTQRFDRGPHGPQMIDRAQLDALLKWMSDHKDRLKFVVTSVPFVAEVTGDIVPPLAKAVIADSGPAGAYTAARDTSRWQQHPERNPANDKWNASRFRTQRDEIVDFIAGENIGQLVFLTGDMHCCYHATMRIGDGSVYETQTIHELAGGPVNQLQLATDVDFKMHHVDHTAKGIAYQVDMQQFHSDVNGVLHVQVDYVRREQIPGDGRALTPEITWNVVRTLTDAGADAWAADPTAPRQQPVVYPFKPTGPIGTGEPVMAGTITFTRKRTTSALSLWPDAAPLPE